MKSPLHILHLEDDLRDAALVEATMRADGIECMVTRVEDRESFVAALESGGIDLVLSDFSLPSFDGWAAIGLLNTRWPQVPVILVSGTMGEELAIDSFKRGVTDYVLKERLSRLAPAVRRAMHEVRNRTDHKHLEAQFIESQKMEVVGHLAAGIAHDFNNILGIIMGYSDMIAEDLAEDDPLRKHTDEIRLALDRATSLTRQLLVFSSKQTVQQVVLDLNAAVEGLEKMLRRLVDENIVLSIALGEGLGHIKADAGYIGQVLLNLVVNARDAMPNGGQLKIETEAARLEAKDGAFIKGAIPGAYVRLRVTDTGTGISDEVKMRLFEAFFTTKPKGKGTGLGLATCHTIVHQCGGFIEVKSEVGQGATFDVYFPVVSQAPQVAAPIASTGPIRRGTETLLVVEDDPTVRHLARQVLQAQGYTVLTATNGQDGLHVSREHAGEAIRLVVTDVIMPLMGGKVMAEWLKVADPHVKILFTSGYTGETSFESGDLAAGTAFLPKPYSPSALVWKVRAMLDQKIEESPS